MLIITTHENIIKFLQLPYYALILSDCKELRMASLNYAEGQLVSTTVTT